MRVIFKMAMASLSLLCGSAFAQEMDVVKTANKPPLAKAYGKFEARHYTRFLYQDNKQDLVTPELQLRPILGATLLNSKFDINYTFKGVKTPESPYLQKGQNEIWMEYIALENSKFRLAPYAWIYLPYKGSPGTDYFIGFAGTSALTRATPAGPVSLIAGIDGAGVKSTGSRDMIYYNDTSLSATQLGLSEPDAASRNPQALGSREEPEHLSYKTSYTVTGRYQPNQSLRGLTMELTAILNQTYAPRYTVYDTQGSVNTSYPGDTETMNRLRLQYAVTDQLTLINDFYQSFDGVYEGRRNQQNLGTNWGLPRLTNLFRLQYLIF